MDPRFDPRLITPDQWNQIRLLVNDAYLMTGLLIVSFGAFLIAHAMIPSLLASEDAPLSIEKARPFFYIVFVVALAFGLYAMARMFHLAVVFVDDFYPRFGY